MRKIKIVIGTVIFLATGALWAKDEKAVQAPSISVGPQYDSNSRLRRARGLGHLHHKSSCDLRWHQVSAHDPYRHAHTQRDDF